MPIALDCSRTLRAGLHPFGDLQQVVALASLDVSGNLRRRRSPGANPIPNVESIVAGVFPLHFSEEQSMDKASIGGVILAIVGIVAGLLMEGGNLGQILQPTAALIVFGGTMGAVLLQFPLTTVVAAFSGMAHIFTAPQKQDHQLIGQLVGFANKARRNGVVSLDADLKTHR